MIEVQIVRDTSTTIIQPLITFFGSMIGVALAAWAFQASERRKHK